MKTHETRLTIIRGWLAHPTDKREDRRADAEDRQLFLLRRDDILHRIRLLRPFGEGARSPSAPARATQRAFYKHLKGARARNRAATRQTAIQQLTWSLTYKLT
jgi:hypothetical protein